MINWQIKIDREIDRQKWGEFVSSHSDGNIFQTPGIHDFFAEVKNFKPLALACLAEDGSIAGILLGVVEREHSGLLGKLSSRAIVWGGPLVGKDAKGEEAANLLLRAFVEKVRKEAIYVEFRNFFDLKQSAAIFEGNGFRFREHLNFRVKTDDGEAVQKRLSSSRKRQIKKSFAAGIKIAEAENIVQVEAFYAILSDLYKNKVHKPLPDWSFFRNFYMHGKGLGVYLLVRFEEKIIGGIVCPIFDNKVIYEWFVCGRDQEYHEQYPSVMATWAAIEYAQKNGLKCFDFMGAGSPDQDYGVREFKARFGGELVNHGRFTRINNRALYAIGVLGMRVLKLLKKI
jgi:serine/alanine adding enzyme